MSIQFQFRVFEAYIRFRAEWVRGDSHGSRVTCVFNVLLPVMARFASDSLLDPTRIVVDDCQ